ncbi:MAG: hypothetical protein FWD49_07230, partial [Firmicutes bacterium]|nr:hypothetical protein [Bacillota bacterium]
SETAKEGGIMNNTMLLLVAVLLMGNCDNDCNSDALMLILILSLLQNRNCDNDCGCRHNGNSGCPPFGAL